MKWPWVSRAAFDALNASLTEERARYNVLLDKYHELIERRAAADKLPQKTLKAVDDGPVDLISMAIAEKAGANTQLRAYLGSYVMREQAKMKRGADDAMSEGELLDSILHWKSASESGAFLPEAESMTS